MNNAAELEWMQLPFKKAQLEAACPKFSRRSLKSLPRTPISKENGVVLMKKIALVAAPFLAVFVLFGGFAVAQAPVLPKTSPSEQMVNDANRSLRNLEIRQQQENRFQFENNSLRAQQLRQQQFPRITGPTVNQNCLPGALNC